MLQPEIGSQKYGRLFAGIESGEIKLPMFQRDFVWSKEQTAKLIDSIIKGFPVGTFVYWQTREELRSVKDIGDFHLPERPKGSMVRYVLDGQQRITSLYAVHKGLSIEKDGRKVGYRDIFVNLNCDPDEDEQIVTVEPPADGTCISVYKLLTGGLAELVREYPSDDLWEKLETYRKRLTGYDFSTIVISDYPIDVACEIFTRINTSGTELTLFEIMVAKTFDQDRDFDLAREYEWLVDNKGAEKDLEDAGFDTIPASTVLQCVAAHMCQQVRRRDILKLDKSDFIGSWPVVKDGIFAAVDYLRTHLRIPVSRLLPYNALLVPFSYFFVRNKGHVPSPEQGKMLTQYFWWASLSRRFSSGVEGKIALDLRRMDYILAGKPPSYRGEELALTVDDLKQRWFSTGDAFCKAILCLYAYFEPKSFQSNSQVTLDNSWLKVASSRNYHHFFPKAYLRKAGYEDWEANSVLNITIVDANLNKRRIRARPPSDYMKEFEEANEELDETMRTHLVDDTTIYGVWSDDYRTFIDRRGERVFEELMKRLRPGLPSTAVRDEQLDRGRGGDRSKPLRQGAWTTDDIHQFLANSTPNQKALFRILARQQTKIARRELVEELQAELGNPEFGGKKLAGTRASITNRTDKLGKDRLIRVSEDGHAYELYPDYLSDIRDWAGM